MDSARKNDTQVHLYRGTNDFVEGLHQRSRSNLHTLQPLGQLNTIQADRQQPEFKTIRPLDAYEQQDLS